MLKQLRLFLLMVLGIGMLPAHAINIDISGGQEGAQPIAVVPFGFTGPGALPVDLAAVIAADLRRSGRFAPVPERELISQPHTAAEVRFEDWRLLNAANLVVGLVQAVGANYVIQFELFDVFKATDQRLTGVSFTVNPHGNLRRVAHQIADIIYKQLTGVRGAFDTHVAYVMSGTRRGRHEGSYTLQIADADGYNPKTVLFSKEPILSPAWSPDGTRLAYVSFESRRSAIYVQDLVSGRREQVASYAGTNSAPAWSPDGSRLAVSLSKDGNPEIYVIDLASRAAQRLTMTSGINTEPVWSPNGSTIVFSSDRGGSPQLYRMSAGGGSPERITFDGSYNTHAQFSPDGNQLVFVHGNGADNHIALINLTSGELRVLTSTMLDKSPSFAPNGAMILYASEHGGHEVLQVVSVDGRTPQTLSVHDGGDVRSPAWGPFNKQEDE